MEIMKNLFDQSAVNAHTPMMLPTDFQQLRRELMRDWKQAALESLGRCLWMNWRKRPC